MGAAAFLMQGFEEATAVVAPLIAAESTAGCTLSAASMEAAGSRMARVRAGERARRAGERPRVHASTSTAGALTARERASAAVMTSARTLALATGAGEVRALLAIDEMCDASGGGPSTVQPTRHEGDAERDESGDVSRDEASRDEASSRDEEARDEAGEPVGESMEERRARMKARGDGGGSTSEGGGLCAIGVGGGAIGHGGGAGAATRAGGLRATTKGLARCTALGGGVGGWVTRAGGMVDGERDHAAIALEACFV